MQRTESFNWSTSAWIKEANSLTTIVNSGLEKSEFDMNFLARFSEIVEAALKAKAHKNNTFQENKQAASATIELLNSLKKIETKILSPITTSVSGQEKLNALIAKTEKLNRKFTQAQHSSLPHPLTTTSTPTLSLTPTPTFPPLITPATTSSTTTTTTTTTTPTTSPSIPSLTTSMSTQKKEKKREKSHEHLKAKHPSQSPKYTRKTVSEDKLKEKVSLKEKEKATLKEKTSWDKKSIKRLARKDIHVDSEKRNGMTPLAYAVKENDLGLVKYLLFKVHGNIEEGFIINANPNQCIGRVPLVILAIEQGNQEIALAFLKAGANPLLEFRSESLLQVAIKHNATEVIQILLQNPKVLAKAKRDSNECLLDALEKNNLNLLGQLLKKGVLPKPDKNLLQPLNEAVASQNYAAAELLLHYKVNPSQIDSEGNYPLLLVKNSEMFLLLMNAGADFNQLTEQNAEGISKLEELLNKGFLKYDEISFLLKGEDKDYAKVCQEKFLISNLIQVCKLSKFQPKLTFLPHKFSEPLRTLGLQSNKTQLFDINEQDIFWLNDLRNTSTAFLSQYPQLMEKDRVEVLIQAFNQPDSINDTLNKIHNGHPTCILSGYTAPISTPYPSSRSTTLTFCGNFLCISDRNSTKKPFRIFKIDPKKISYEMIKNIEDAKELLDNKEFSKMIKKLLEQVNATSGPYENLLEKSFPLGPQSAKVGALENLEGSLWFLLAASNSSIKKALEKGVHPKYELENLDKEINHVNAEMDSLVFFSQLYHLNQYLESNKKDRKYLKIDEDLIKNAMNAIEAYLTHNIPESLKREFLELKEQLENPKSRLK